MNPTPANPDGPLENIVWPPLSRWSPDALARHVKWLESSQWLTPDELERNAFRQLAITARHCARHSPLFAERLRSAGISVADFARPEGLSALPVMTRRQVQTAGKDFFCSDVPASHLPIRDGKTSGSTGEPLAVKSTQATALSNFANTIRNHTWHQRDATRPLLSIRAHLEKPVERPDWGAPFNLLFPCGPALGLSISTPFDEQASRMRLLKPGTLLTYPNNLLGLIDELAASGGAPPGLQHIRTTGESVTAELRDRARSFFGLEVEDTYSSTEAGSIAMQCRECGGYHVMAEAMTVEVIDEAGRPCRPGETGRVIVTDHTNFAMPLIRYEIGDYAEVGEPGSCGRGLPVLNKILGRQRNLMILPDGRRQWPLTGFYRFREVAPVSQYQFVQVDRHTIEINLVAERPLSEPEESALRTVIQKALGHPFNLPFRYHSTPLSRGAGGKFEEFICKAT